MGVTPCVLFRYEIQICVRDCMKTKVWKCGFVVALAAIVLTGCTQGKEKKTDKEDTKKEKTNQNVVDAAYDEELERIIAGSFYYEIEGNAATLTEVYQYQESEELPDAIRYEGKEYSLEKIGVNAFQEDSVLRVITLPQGLKEIGNEAFYGCDNIEEITIPDAVSKIGNGVFFNCERLQKFTFGDGTDTVSDEMFSNCYALSEISFPKKLLHIGAEAFWACENLNQFAIPADVVSIGSRAFYGSGIASMEIQSDSLKPANTMFEGMNQLQTLAVPEKKQEEYKALEVLSEITISPLS